MRFERDPLSVLYDTATGGLLGRAYAAPGTWVYAAVPRPALGAGATAWLRATGVDLGATDSGGLTTWERAYQRSLYWVHNGGGNGNRNAVWSIQREWGPVTARGRLLGVRASDPAVARRALNRKPRSQAWWATPELRSGGLGSGRERF